MRRILLPLLLIAASPATDEAERLLDRGEAERAFATAEAASRAGDLDALNYVAWCYDTGRCAGRDQARAATLYRQAAERGQRHAQWRLGVMLDLGEGVAENPAEAFRWISSAADQGSVAAATSMGVMYANGRGVPVDYEQSMRWYRAAARLGDAHGFYGVGVLYANGQGVALDQEEALAWMLASAALGDAEAARVSTDFDLDSAATSRAAARANAILREFGRGDVQVPIPDDAGTPIV